MQKNTFASFNVLFVLWNHLGSFDKVARVVKLAAYMAIEPDFVAQPKVADTSSEQLRDVFGGDKLPVRMVLGVAGLPLGVPVLVELVFELAA
ncbi:MAG TPA: RidA family protein [Terracidiphilus sp.]|nr:RidA family protein [Terracidiphilus sp.]